MQYEITTRKSTKKAALTNLMAWLVADLKLTNAKAFVQVILTDDKNNFGLVSQIAPGYFIVALQKRMSLEKTLQTLCHEMVHVKQYLKGKLRNCPDTGDFIWCNMHFSRKTDYYHQPWEIQAFSQEILLFRRATEFFTSRV